MLSALAQERFTEALLRDMAKVPLPLDRIFSQTVSGRPKSEVLLKLAERHPRASYHFVEDKMGTLEKALTPSIRSAASFFLCAPVQSVQADTDGVLRRPESWGGRTEM